MQRVGACFTYSCVQLECTPRHNAERGSTSSTDMGMMARAQAALAATKHNRAWDVSITLPWHATKHACQSTHTTACMSQHAQHTLHMDRESGQAVPVVILDDSGLYIFGSCCMVQQRCTFTTGEHCCTHALAGKCF